MKIRLVLLPTRSFSAFPVNGWQNYHDHVVAISADRKSITIEYKDGGFGDLDGVANKIVVDPVGFGIGAGGGGGGGGSGGGCLISAAAAGLGMPKASLVLLLVCGFLMIGLSVFRKMLNKLRTQFPIESDGSSNK